MSRASEALARRVEDREAYMLAIRTAIEVNDTRDGDVGYRHSYDKALHVLVALDAAGFKIVKGQRK